MKLSTILSAAVRPWLRFDRHIKYDQSWVTIGPDRESGYGIGLSINPDRCWVPRARTFRIGDLTVAWWGRDTLVHPTEAS
jgi:hypothetical protein